MKIGQSCGLLIVDRGAIVTSRFFILPQKSKVSRRGISSPRGPHLPFCRSEDCQGLDLLVAFGDGALCFADQFNRVALVFVDGSLRGRVAGISLSSDGKLLAIT